MNFSGSYHGADVTFLLKPLPLADFVDDVAEKERLIQSGQRHYSEMLSPERPPSARYVAVFDEACRANGERMARDCLRLAQLVAQRRSGPVTVVSLARGGTPVGVLLKRLLERVHDRVATHYSVSIVRDRGIDANALRHILAQGHAPASIVFVDGWTGKGVIARELAASIERFNREHGTEIDSGLFVLSDLAGAAACAASCDDYLIPSSILNATVSGLVSRSVLAKALGPRDFHGCVLYSDFAAHDRSRDFVDDLERRALALCGQTDEAQAVDARLAASRSQAYVAAAMARYGVNDVNLVKPGIGEATRVLLRRAPRLLVLRDAQAPAVAHLRLLAEEKQVPVEIDPALPYQAVSLIRSASDA
ncbi:cysteine protease StiP family protein [Massilia sp.]|uniref:cysteine protease StiP family protein n=1 Tax=Massilia sp. TaxID=1882437 RepID=UPI0028ABD752|nr:cysteine protease StiP family protein [Massilia sp.]